MSILNDTVVFLVDDIQIGANTVPLATTFQGTRIILASPIPIPSKTLPFLGTSPYLDTLTTLISNAIHHAPRFTRLHIRTSKCILVEGIPGVGKSSLIAQAVFNAGKRSIVVDLLKTVEDMADELYTAPVVDLELKVSKAVMSSPCILVIRNLDVLGSKHLPKDLLLLLLRQLDMMLTCSGVVVVSETRNISRLPSILLKDKHFMHSVKMGLPDLSTRRAILETAFAGLLTEPGLEMSVSQVLLPVLSC